MQALRAQAESEGQYTHAREPVALQVLVHCDAPADLDKEQFLGQLNPAAARPQIRRADLGHGTQAEGCDGEARWTICA